jgi:anti-sigma regulatory factor (Ser/Thr protein kinase)
VTLELHATPEEVMRAVEALQGTGRARGIPEQTLFGLALALEECASNIVNHALRRDPARTFRVEFDRQGDAFVIELRDDGPEFDPTTAAVRKPQADDADLPGGWGIALARRYTDEMRYSRQGEENVLRLIKRLASTAGQP